ncbi:MAG: triose-phosphate isomerase [Rhodothermales bacterium]|nr:triose-phosphate isomerase [Rhodothermales bacterium]
MLIAGNWKMNTDVSSATELARNIVESLNEHETVAVAVCPPAINLADVARAIDGSSVHLGAQNMHFEDSGAFTGEVSADMLTAVGCRYVIIGHSERRQYFAETDESVNLKVRQATRRELIPIVCVGEHLGERQGGMARNVVSRQLSRGLEEVEITSGKDLVIAYEPVWAIGTGHTATPEQAQEMHADIRRLLTDQFGAETARQIKILYGGSMKPDNADELLRQPDVDGGLIGGASLRAESFISIIESAAAAND